MKLYVSIVLITLFAMNTVHATNTVSDGTFVGTGTWSSTGPAGTYGGLLEQSWTQDGESAHNIGLLKISGTTVQSFDDEYKFIPLGGVNYRMDRLIESSYVEVGGCTQSSSGYNCAINQVTSTGTLVVTESGFMQNANTLVRIGTITAPDSTVTTYSSTLIRQ